MIINTSPVAFSDTAAMLMVRSDHSPQLNDRSSSAVSRLTFANFVADAFTVFIFILWLWLFITVASDLFRRKDVSGWGKVLWVIFLVVLPYIGVFAYLLTQGRGMADGTRRKASKRGTICAR